MARFRDDALVLRIVDWSETSQVASLLTRAHGKTPVLAKGSKRMSPGALARFSGGLELLTRGQAVGITKATAELATLTEWDLQQTYPHLREQLPLQQIALYAADLTTHMLADHDPHERLFDAMVRLLHDLAEPGPAVMADRLLRYQWALLVECGYRPELDRDARTGRALDENAPMTFDPHSGGVTQSAPANDGPQGPWRLRRRTVLALRQVAAIHADQSDAGDMPPSDRESLSGQPALDRPAAAASNREPPRASSHAPHAELAQPAGAPHDRVHRRAERERAADPHAPDRADRLNVDPATLVRANRLLCVTLRTLLGKALPSMDAVMGETFNAQRV